MKAKRQGGSKRALQGAKKIEHRKPLAVTKIPFQEFSVTKSIDTVSP